LHFVSSAWLPASEHGILGWRGFRYRLHNAEGEDIGEFTTIVPNWTVGDTFTTGAGRQFRILSMVPVVDLEESVFNAMWMVEPVDDQG
jgi:hypothetical protein